jgi:sugar (pentulose or hexulose) kinase
MSILDSFVLGLDIGTTNIKACAVDGSGRFLAISSCRNKVNIGLGGRVEQNGDEMWKSVQIVLKDVLKKIYTFNPINGATTLKSLSLSTQGGTVFFLDKDNKHVRPGITWMDTRPAMGPVPITDEVVGAPTTVGRDCRRITDQKLFAITGRTTSIGCLPFLQLLWMKKNEPETRRRTKKYEFVDSLIYEKFTGRSVIDPSSAVMTMLYDVRKGTWSDTLLKMVGIKRIQLPEILPSGEVAGTIKQSIAKLLGLPEGLKIICGGHDQYCAALGSGVINPGDTLLSCGTAWALITIWNRPIFKFGSNFSPGPHVLKDKWGMLTAISKAGAFFDWTMKILNFKNYQDALSKIEEVPDGCGGLLFLPLDNGKGVFHGLGLHHDRQFLLKSVMEGLGFEVTSRIRILEELGIKPTSITMVGGAAKSEEWARIISNITQLEVKVPPETESACRGAAMLAASNEIGFKGGKIKYQIYTPSKKSIHVYRDALKKYGKIKNIETSYGDKLPT